MNHGIFLVKVMEKPINLSYGENLVLKILVKFAKPRKKNVKNEIYLILWGGFREDFINFYKIKDYLLIEGIITSKVYKESQEEINLIAKRVYPFLLD
uniref:Uncharacterized protein n=1 Tax=Dictyopteris divaricata TaxID=156996 RepID=A0A2I4Q2M0_9PHAE|nr:hypothetical protein [Dictyopteris divaricata]YP_010205381.1 hypothetical protein LK366_pgp010 [Grateloupia livida]AQZ25092.1 hypothetical protein [Dictyopteris divaricata]UAV85950.1 hypothetical protein [Grateloupia livida]